MLKKLTALTAALATAATVATAAAADETTITAADVNAEAGSADTCLLDTIGNYSNGATTTVAVNSVATCFALAKQLSDNVPQQDGWRKTQATAMKAGEIVDNFACRNRSNPTAPKQESCFRP